MTQITSTTSLLRDAVHSVDFPDVTKPVIEWADLRAFADRAAADKGEWGGGPIPVDEFPLVLEPRYPFQSLNGAKWENGKLVKHEPSKVETDYTLLNQWYSYYYARWVYVCRESDGISKVYSLPDGPGRRLNYWLNTLGVASNHAWDMKVESRAIEKLKSLITEHALHCYQLTGSFLETSPRSQVTYLFRKLRPTIALRPDKSGQQMRVIAVLCLHPLGYYAETWAGVMCPTDDVIAHLMMMRADEHQFWKKANHHEMHEAEAGI